MGDRAQGRPRKTSIAEDITEAVTRLVRGNSGLTGGASRTLSGRQMQLDDAEDAALNGTHDRQHTDKANR